MNEIEIKILNKKPDIDKSLLTYYTNYLSVVSKKELLPKSVSIDEIIDNLVQFDNFVLFSDDDSITKELGNNFKGLRDPESKTLYVRDSLPDDIKEMVIYHEIHHAAQTTQEMMKSKNCGINQESNFGRMIMEGQTEWFAEEVYKNIHNIEYKERNISSTELRISNGQTICSALHNYEMYDAMLSKLSIILDVDKNYFVTLNYMYKDNEGLSKLKKDYEQATKNKNISIDFETMMRIYDYTYVVDYISYVKNPEQETLNNGMETKEKYVIHYDYQEELSKERQKNKVMFFDKEVALSLYCDDMTNESDFVRFSKYIFYDENRAIINGIIQNNKIENNKENSIK